VSGCRHVHRRESRPQPRTTAAAASEERESQCFEPTTDVRSRNPREPRRCGRVTSRHGVGAGCAKVELGADPDALYCSVRCHFAAGSPPPASSCRCRWNCRHHRRTVKLSPRQAAASSQPPSGKDAERGAAPRRPQRQAGSGTRGPSRNHKTLQASPSAARRDCRGIRVRDCVVCFMPLVVS
jgi:hypothetical protein